MSDFQHTFTVRQHTPLIHFQADQDGAFLRVSELKPAFDRYLWEKVWTSVEDIQSNIGMLVCYDENKRTELIEDVEKGNNISLDYSLDINNVIIEKNTDDEPKVVKNFPCYFADLGNSENEPQFVFCKPDFQIVVTCFNSELLAVIIKSFPRFLSRTNFGTRKSKGFGSFTCIDSNSGLPILPSSKTPGLYSFEIKNIDDTNNNRGLFEHIDLFWKVIRNGIDVPLKLESALSKWTKSKNLHFDKKVLKDFVDGSTRYKGRELPDSSTTKPVYLYRDMLGLASTTEWASQKATLNKLSTDDTIQRYMSPILLKPVRTSNNSFIVYIFTPLVNHNLLYKKFRIEVAVSNSKLDTSLQAEMPSDYKILREFMEYVSSTFKSDFIRLNKNNGKPDMKKLITVFTSLKKLSQP